MAIRRRPRLVSQMNVVPYIDVMLVLLIIFLFTGLTIPVPIPEEKGLPVQLDLGNTDFGSGEEQPQSTSEPEVTEPITEPEPVESAPTDAPEEVATQDEEHETGEAIMKAKNLGNLDAIAAIGVDIGNEIEDAAACRII